MDMASKVGKMGEDSKGIGKKGVSMAKGSQLAETVCRNKESGKMVHKLSDPKTNTRVKAKILKELKVTKPIKVIEEFIIIEITFSK